MSGKDYLMSLIRRMEDDGCRVSVEWGHADGYWDVVFDKIDTRLSVRIDETTGAVDLNSGYDEHTASWDVENSLFRQVKDQVESALVEALRDNDQPEYAAFKARFAPSNPSI